MIPSLPSWWDAILEHQPETKRPATPTPDRLQYPLQRIPRAFDWTSDLDAWSRINYEKPMSGFEMMMLQRACMIRGESPENHSMRRQAFSRFVHQLSDRGYELPIAMTEVFTNDHLYNLFRFSCQSFGLPDTLASLPSDNRLVLFLFMSDAQGCNFTHLLLAPNGEHVVTRSCHPYGLADADNYTKADSDEHQLFLLAESFDLFLCNAVDEIIEFESDAGKEWVKRGDLLRDADRHDDAKHAYRLGLAYDPDYRLLQDRLRELENG